MKRWAQFIALCRIIVMPHVRNRRGIMMLVLAPLVIEIVTGLVLASNDRSHGFSMALVATPNAIVTDRMARHYSELPGLNVKVTTESDALSGIQNGHFSFAIALAPTGRPQHIWSSRPWVGLASLVAGPGSDTTAKRSQIAVTEVNVRVAFQRFDFLFAGLISYAIFQVCTIGTAIAVLEARAMGILRHLLLTPVEIPILLAAYLAVRFTLCAGVVAIMYVVGMVWFNISAPVDPFLFVSTFVATAALATVLGFALGAKLKSRDGAQQLFSLLSLGLLGLGRIFSAAAYPTSFIALAAYVFPFSYLAEEMRSAIIGLPPLSPSWLSLSVVMIWFVGGGLYSARRFSPEIRQ